MHPTAITNCRHFFDTYAGAFPTTTHRVVEIGSQDVNGSLRTCCPSRFDYVGVDFVAGNGVDVVLQDPYVLPFDNGSVDIVLTSSCFEHSEMFWVLFLEAMRILKPHGLLYLNVPSNGSFHRYPVDCWRFYPDSGNALVTWAKRNGINAALLESYTSEQTAAPLDEWNDYIAIFVKDGREINQHPNRILRNHNDLFNGRVFGSDDVINYQRMPEDKRRLRLINRIICGEAQFSNRYGLPAIIADAFGFKKPGRSDKEKLALIRKVIDGELKVMKN